MNNTQSITDIYQMSLILLALRNKLVTMARQAECLKAFPDRYGSCEVLKKCEELNGANVEDMSLDEVVGFSAEVESTIENIKFILRRFDSDDNTRIEMYEAIDADKAVLCKYSVCYAELRKYVSESPHQGCDDYAVIKKHIDLLKQADVLLTELKESIDKMRGYKERHNKGRVIKHFSALEDEMFKSMCCNDVESYRKRLEELKEQIQSVEDAFDAEYDELEQLKGELQDNTCMWEEQYEELLEKIGDLQERDLRMVRFNLKDIQDEVGAAKIKKERDISSMTEKYGWLLRRNHVDFHNGLISQCISYRCYQDKVEERRIEKNDRIKKNIWTGVKWTAGAVVFVVIGIGKFVFGILDGILSNEKKE